MARLHPADNPRGRARLGFGMLAMCAALTSAGSASAAGDTVRGAQIFAMAGGCGCHTSEAGPVGAGGGEVPTPFGTFYGTNITPDRETGIGAWSDAEITDAIRGGWLRDGTAESPAMPYYRYAGMADGDVTDLIAYLRSLPAVKQRNKPHEGTLPLPRLAYRAWRILFAPAVERPDTPPTEPQARGRYLVDHVAICGDCHTPRDVFGAPDRSRYLAGSVAGPGGAKTPNITPDRSGIGSWDKRDIIGLLTTGMLPDFDNVQGLMAEVIDGKAGSLSYKGAPKEDLESIAVYLKTVPAMSTGTE